MNKIRIWRWRLTQITMKTHTMKRLSTARRANLQKLRAVLPTTSTKGKKRSINREIWCWQRAEILEPAIRAASLDHTIKNCQQIGKADLPQNLGSKKMAVQGQEDPITSRKSMKTKNLKKEASHLKNRSSLMILTTKMTIWERKKKVHSRRKMESTLLKMEQCIRDSGWADTATDSASKLGLTGLDTKANGRKIRLMGGVFSITSTGTCLMVSGVTTRRTALARTTT